MDMIFFLTSSAVIGQVDAVAEGLAHLGLAVDTGQAQAGLVVREQDLRLDQRVPVNRIELADDFLCLLKHREPDPHPPDTAVALNAVMSARLTDRIGEETDRDAGFKVAHLDFGFHSGIALEPGYGNQVHIIERQLAEFRDLRLDEHGGFLPDRGRRTR